MPLQGLIHLDFKRLSVFVRMLFKGLLKHRPFDGFDSFHMLPIGASKVCLEVALASQNPKRLTLPSSYLLCVSLS